MNKVLRTLHGNVWNQCHTFVTVAELPLLPLASDIHGSYTAQPLISSILITKINHKIKVMTPYILDQIDTLFIYASIAHFGYNCASLRINGSTDLLLPHVDVIVSKRERLLM